MKPRYIPRPVVYDGKQVGWRLFVTGGLLGTLTFANRFIWFKEST